MFEELDLSMQVENFNGKIFIFQLQLNEYNLKLGWEFYIAKKFFESITETDKAIENDYVFFKYCKITNLVFYSYMS